MPPCLFYFLVYTFFLYASLFVSAWVSVPLVPVAWTASLRCGWAWDGTHMLPRCHACSSLSPPTFSICILLTFLWTLPCIVLAAYLFSILRTAIAAVPAEFCAMYAMGMHRRTFETLPVDFLVPALAENSLHYHISASYYRCQPALLLSSPHTVSYAWLARGEGGSVYNLLTV